MSSPAAQRPPFALRAVNWAGARLARWGLRPRRIDTQRLFDAARRRTGLEDFGDPFFQEPLERLLASYDEESQHSTFGHVFTFLNLRLLLTNRLRMQHYWSHVPEILEKPVKGPLIIAGMPRTGTTLLYNLLAQDPANRPLRMWEANEPAPDPRPGKKDTRRRKSRRIIRAIKRIAPGLMAIHPLTADGPEECSRLLLNSFITYYAAFENHIPSYRDWLLQLPEEVFDQSYFDYVRQLQLLQWQEPPQERWVLKSPAHVLGIDSLLRVLPDAHVVQTHREPQQFIPSTCSLCLSYRTIASDHCDASDIGREITELCREGIWRAEQAKVRHGAHRVYDVRYQDLIDDPLGVVRHLYEYFGLPYSRQLEDGARKWLDEHPRNKHGVHHYRAEQFGLGRAELVEPFEEYRSRYRLGSASESRPRRNSLTSS